MGFSRQEYWSGLSFPSPGDLPNPGIELGSLALQADALPSEPPGKHGVTSKFGLGVQNKAGQRLIEFCQENALVIANTLFQQHKRRLYTWNHQMVNTKIRLIIFFEAKDGVALYNQQKQDQELTVVQIMKSLLTNSDLN